MMALTTSQTSLFVCWIGIMTLLWIPPIHSQSTITCFDEDRGSVPPNLFAKQLQNSSLNIFRQLAMDIPGNMFTSPYSLWNVLNLAYVGAEGETRLQLEKALNVDSKVSAITNVKVISSLLQHNLNQSQVIFGSSSVAYLSDKLYINQCLESVLSKSLKEIDFTQNIAAVKTINTHISNVTHGKINDFLEFLQPDTLFALINAVYFKGLWVFPFNAKLSSVVPFYGITGNSSGNVRMMFQTREFNYGSAPSLKARLLELPYGIPQRSSSHGTSNSKPRRLTTSMFLILPDKDTAIEEVVQLIDSDKLNEAIRNMGVTIVDVGLPRFNMTTKLAEDLKQSLRSLGIVDLFHPTKADLSTFVRGEQVYAQEAIHQAVIEVNEEGTVAAAASGIISTRTGTQKVEVFQCNRPFLFLIHDKMLGITLFAGKITTPIDLESA